MYWAKLKPDFQNKMLDIFFNMSYVSNEPLVPFNKYHEKQETLILEVTSE